MVYVVLLVTMVLGGVQAMAMGATATAPVGAPALSDDFAGVMSLDQLLEQVGPLLQSQSVDDVGTLVKSRLVPFEQKLRLLRTITHDDAYGLSMDDAVQLIFDVANHYPARSPEQWRVFDLLAEHFDLVRKTHPYFIALRHGYQPIIDSFNAWMMQTQAQHPGFGDRLSAKRMLMQAVADVLDNNDDAIFQRVIPMVTDKSDLNEMLWHVARTGRGIAFIPKLLAHGANINDVRDGKTPLIESMMSGQKEAGQAFIAAGADVHKMVNPEIGTALQQAFDRHDAAMEGVLRAAGARE